eukprot:3602929-Rhodomonas_salina.2
MYYGGGCKGKAAGADDRAATCGSLSSGEDRQRWTGLVFRARLYLRGEEFGPGSRATVQLEDRIRADEV